MPRPTFQMCGFADLNECISVPDVAPSLPRSVLKPTCGCNTPPHSFSKKKSLSEKLYIEIFSYPHTASVKTEIGLRIAMHN